MKIARNMLLVMGFFLYVHPLLGSMEPAESDWYEIAFSIAAKYKMEVVLPGVYYTYNE